ncbi:MAG: helix-turn-helix transcriptional regulator [Bacteroidetes bacterium]|nr:helix-turn-helix transcriptional regulator [Bacteroidota bacterium]
MERKRDFFAKAASAKLTGEQCRVLLCLLSTEADGVISITRAEIAGILELAMPNVSRAITALKDAGLLETTESQRYTGKRDVLLIKRKYQI